MAELQDASHDETDEQKMTDSVIDKPMTIAQIREYCERMGLRVSMKRKPTIHKVKYIMRGHGFEVEASSAAKFYEKLQLNPYYCMISQSSITSTIKRLRKTGEPQRVPNTTLMIYNIRI